MWVTIVFDKWADLDREAIVQACVPPLDQGTAVWHGPGKRELSYRTQDSCADVLEHWEDEGFNFHEFESFTYAANRPAVYDYQAEKGSN